MKLKMGPGLRRIRPAALALAFLRSATQPANGPALAQSNSVPAGTDPLWFSQAGGAWTRIVGDFADMPFTLTPTTPADFSIVGNTVTRTGATQGFTGSGVSLPTINGGARLRVRIKALLLSYADIITPSESDFYAAIRGDTGATLGYTGGGTATLVVNDVLDVRRAADGTTMSILKNDVLVGTAGATTAPGANSTSAAKGALHMLDQNSSYEVLGYGPLGPDVAIKVAQTSPDGTTWRVPTAGDTQLRVSNDAGITAPSVVIT